MVSTRPGEWGFLCFLSWEYAQIIINHPNEAIFVLKQPWLTWVPHRKPPHLSAPGVEQRQFNSASLVPPACHTGCHTVQFNPELRLLEKWCATKKVPRLCRSCLLLMHLQHPWWWHLFSRTSPSWRVTRMAPASSVTSLRHAGEHRTMGHRPFQPWRDACRDPCWGSREIAGAVVSCRRPWKMPHPTSSRLLPMSCKAKPWNSANIFMPISSCRNMWSLCQPVPLVSCLRSSHHMQWRWRCTSMAVGSCSASSNTAPGNHSWLPCWNQCWVRFRKLRNFSKIRLEATCLTSPAWSQWKGQGPNHTPSWAWHIYDRVLMYSIIATATYSHCLC